MTWNPRTEDDHDPTEDLRRFTVKATIQVEMIFTANKNAEEDDLATLVLDSCEEMDAHIGSEVVEIDITGVEEV